MINHNCFAFSVKFCLSLTNPFQGMSNPSNFRALKKYCPATLGEACMQGFFSRIFNFINPAFLENRPSGVKATGYDVLIKLELRIRIKGLDNLKAIDIIYNKTDKLTANSMWIMSIM